MKIYNSTGDFVKLPAAADTESGAFVRSGLISGFAVDTVKSGETLTLMTRGVFDVTVAGTADFGDAVYAGADGVLTATKPAAPNDAPVGVAVGAGYVGTNLVRIV